jgi:hypothetical protein
VQRPDVAQTWNFTRAHLSQCGVQAVYKDQAKIVQSIRDNMPGYKNFTEYEFGFKIRNKDKPEAWIDADEVVKLPEEAEVPKGPLEGLKSSVSSLFNRT